MESDLAFRVYMSDVFYHYTHNRTVEVRFWDMIHPKPIDHRTVDEIVDDIIKGGGLQEGVNY